MIIDMGKATIQQVNIEVLSDFSKLGASNIVGDIT